MLQLASQQDQSYILDIIEDWERAKLAPRLVFTLGGEDYSDLIPSGLVKQDAMAISMEVTFADFVPRSLGGAPTYLGVDVDGILIPLLTGYMSLPVPNDDGVTTKLVAASVGALAARWPLDEVVEYSGVRPDYIVRDALRRLPYIPGSVRVDAAATPLQYFATGSQNGPFNADQKITDILSAVGGSVLSKTGNVLYTFRDTAVGGHHAGISPSLATLPGGTEEYTSEELIFWKSPALNLDQYAEVEVFQLNQDGTNAFEPARAKVQYIGYKYPPPAGLRLRIPFTDTSSGAPERAQQLAYDKAQELGRGLYTNPPILPFHPLREQTDVFTVYEDKVEADKSAWQRAWTHYVDAYEHDWVPGFSTKHNCTVTLTDEQQLKVPALLLTLISGGISTPLWGESPTGEIYFDQSLAWVSQSGDDVIFDVGLAGGLVVDAGDDILIS